MILEKLERELCCGCAACHDICNHKAIQMKPNEEGFIYPHLINSKCTKCNLCDSVCPILNSNKSKYNIEQESYAAQNNNTKTLLNSSSGGIFSAIAEYILNMNGIICGAAFDENLYLKHTIIENNKDLSKLRGSKYMWSENQHIYKEIKKILQTGRFVYYVGTGCQVAGLRLYLRKEYNNLYTSDLICHGTPSYKIFKSFVNEIENKYDCHITNYKFRDKTINGWSCSSSFTGINTHSKKIIQVYKDRIMDAYFNLFISGNINRESCYKCPFTTKERSGDITLADYWGIKKYHKIDTHNGISAIIVNSLKGKKLLCEINNITLIKSHINWISEGNYNLEHNTLRPIRRNTIYQEFSNNPRTIIKEFSKNFFFKKIKFYIKSILRKNETLFRFLYKIKNNI